jgi:hypothetical protein
VAFHNSMAVSANEHAYLLALVQADIRSDRLNDLDAAEEAFSLEAKLVAMRQAIKEQAE